MPHWTQFEPHSWATRCPRCCTIWLLTVDPFGGRELRPDNASPCDWCRYPPRSATGAIPTVETLLSPPVSEHQY